MEALEADSETKDFTLFVLLSTLLFVELLRCKEFSNETAAAADVGGCGGRTNGAMQPEWARLEVITPVPGSEFTAILYRLDSIDNSEEVPIEAEQ